MCVRIAVAFASLGATGGLRPPLFCCGANVWRRNCGLCDARTLVYKSGGRQPAVATKRICNVARFFRERVRSPTTAGLRQPLLVHGVGQLKNNDTRGAQTHVLHERRAASHRANGS
jgi:hypothetical protein